MPTIVNITSGRWLVQFYGSDFVAISTTFYSIYLFNLTLDFIVASFLPEVLFICLVLTAGEIIFTDFSDFYLESTGFCCKFKMDFPGLLF